MKMIELTNIQYKNYSNIHKNKNFGQTVEFSMLKDNISKKRIFLGLIDEDNNLCAATLIIVNNISPIVKEAYAPDGFLIDYDNFSLIKVFTDELKKYLLKERITYLITNPMYHLRIYDKSGKIIINNEYILSNFYTLGYKNIGYTNDFEKYDVIIDGYQNYQDIYHNFNRNTKRNIKEATKYGITLHKGSIKDLEKAYDIFKKKTNESLYYYQNLMSVYNKPDNKVELFIAKLNPNTYLLNSKKIYEKIKDKNERIHHSFNIHIGKIKEKLFNKMVNSDRELIKSEENLKQAILLNEKYKDDIIIASSIIIKNNREIYFLIDGFKDEYRLIHSTHFLKWAIIKKYFSKGYRIFNLGEIHREYFVKSNKYYGQYMYKIGFGGKVVEYSPNLLLIINNPIYLAYNKIKNFKFK